MVKNLSASAGDVGLIPRLARSPGEGKRSGYSSILDWEIPWTEEPGKATVHGAAKSQTGLSNETTTTA